MKGQQFTTLEELVRAVVDGSDESAYVGKYRGKDFYVLAASDDAAFAVVAKSLGVEIGIVPLDLVIKATKNALKDIPGEVKPPATPELPATLPKWDLEHTPIAEVKTIAGGLGCDIAKKSKAEICAMIREKEPAYRKPDPDQAGFEFGANDKK